MSRSRPAAPAQIADRNLLFGILALQMNFIERDGLVAAMHAWMIDKSRSLGDILREQGALSNETQVLLEALVQQHLQLHGGDPQRSLARLQRAEQVCEELKSLRDTDLEASLAHIAPDSARSFPSSSSEIATAGPRYRPLRPHAKGGIGEVWIAQDLEMSRDVALKELQPAHSGNADSRARFLFEAQVTGGLEHPGVVPVYGLGQYSDGRPYYAMRFIRGSSLSQAIRRFHEPAMANHRSERTLELRKLLAQFIDVCNAVEYAHSRGVLHRDLKPSNVMLGKYGETLVVDWGLAKAVGRQEPSRRDDESTLLPASGSTTATRLGSVVGTPAYMSPEQAAGRVDELGPASDVYSLGATLFQLLTGQLPVAEDDLQEMLQMVRQGEIRRPREVNPAVPPPLEAICLKAMALNPDERYATAISLAEDLEHWLADEPVTAYDERLTERVGRWSRRHRGWTQGGAAALLLVTLISSVAVAFVERARENEAAQRTLAVAAEQQTAAERDRAEAYFEMARGAVDRYLTQVSESEQLHAYGLEPLRRDLLLAARDYYQKFAEEKSDDPSVVAERARALARLASIHEELGAAQEAEPLYREALDLFDGLRQQRADDNELAQSEALTQLYLAGLLIDAHRIAEAQEPIARATQTFQQLANDGKGRAEFRAGWARALTLESERLRQAAFLDDASAALEKANAVYSELHQQNPNHADYRLEFAQAQFLLAVQYLDQWQFEKSATACQNAKQLAVELCQQEPRIPTYQYMHARACRLLAEYYSKSWEYQKAIEETRLALSIAEALCAEHPRVPAYQVELAITHLSLGRAELTGIRWLGHASSESAAEHVAVSIEVMQELRRQFPARFEYRFLLGQGETLLGQISNWRGDFADAEAHFRQALSLSIDERPGAAASPDTLDYLTWVAETRSWLGRVQLAQNNYADGFLNCTRAIEEIDALLPKVPSHTFLRLTLVEMLSDRAYAHKRQGRSWDALADLSRLRDELTRFESLQTSDRPAWYVSWLKIMSAQIWSEEMEIADEVRVRMGKSVREGDYRLGATDAVRLAETTGRGDDMFLAARTIAVAAAAAARDESLEPAEQKERAEQYVQQAVRLLEQAWLAGFIEKEETFLGAFAQKSNLRLLRQDADLKALHGHPAFQELLERIEKSE